MHALLNTFLQKCPNWKQKPLWTFLKKSKPVTNKELANKQNEGKGKFLITILQDLLVFKRLFHSRLLNMTWLYIITSYHTDHTSTSRIIALLNSKLL